MKLEASSLVSLYFRYLQRKDVNRLLLLFDDKAEIYEPISKHGLVSGKDEIETFLTFLSRIRAVPTYELTSVIPPLKPQQAVKANAVVWLKGQDTMTLNHVFTFNPFAEIELSGRNAIRRLDITIPK